MRWAKYVIRVLEKRNAYRILVGEQERKRSLGRPRLTCENYIKTDLKDVGSGDIG
jgi:hypothetical protein